MLNSSCLSSWCSLSWRSENVDHFLENRKHTADVESYRQIALTLCQPTIMVSKEHSQSLACGFPQRTSNHRQVPVTVTIRLCLISGKPATTTQSLLSSTSVRRQAYDWRTRFLMKTSKDAIPGLFSQSGFTLGT